MGWFKRQLKGFLNTMPTVDFESQAMFAAMGMGM